MMKGACVRWWLVLCTAAVCAVVPACSDTVQKPAPKAEASVVPQAPEGAEGTEADRRAPSLSGGGAAKGPPRQHPFAPVIDKSALRARAGPLSGPLTLKAILADPERRAIIQAGKRTYFVREGDTIGALEVLAIRESEVLLGVGPRKQILPLYESWHGREQ